MKNKFRGKIGLFLGIVLLTLWCCEHDHLHDEDDHVHGKSPHEVSLDFFKQETKIDNIDAFLKQKMNKNNVQSRMASYALTEFFIDTTLINQYVLNENKKTFSFRIYPKYEVALPNEVYNLVVSKRNNQWETSFFLLTKKSVITDDKLFASIQEVFYSAGLPSNISARMINGTGFVENVTYHCTLTGSCTPTYCDRCKLCITRTIEYVGLENPEDYETHNLQETPFIYNGGGGGYVQPEEVINPDPYKDITTKINTPEINSKIVNFNTPAVLNLNYEKGFDFVENADGNLSYNPIDGNSGQTGITFTIDSNGNTIGFIHSHFDKPNMSPIFTIEDLKSFNAIDIFRSTRGKTRTNTCLMLVSRAGVFALVIEDFTLMKNYGDKLHDPVKFEILKEEYNGDISTMLTDDDTIKQVLQVLPKYGVGLYKANDNLNGWNKLSYNPNTNSIIPIPCN